MGLVSIILAAAASMGLGFLWYSPVLFGKTWSRLMGFTKESMKEAQAKMGPMYTLSAVGALLTAYVLVRFGPPVPVFQVIWIWLGFVFPVQLTGEIFSGKKFQPALLAINTGYQLASLLIMALILSLIR